MRFSRALCACAVFALPLCASIVDYSLEIKPQTGSDVYQMSLNAITTFQIQGSGKDAETKHLVTVEIDKAWWSFDKDILAKITSGRNSITLKAIRTGSAQLTVNAMMNNRAFKKAITILVK